MADRIADHPGLGGPERDFFRARLAYARGDAAEARRLATACLDRLPGHSGYLAFARSIDAPIPGRARIIMERRSSHFG